MIVTVREIAKFLNASIEGNDNLTIHSFSKIQEAIPGTITFLANPIYEKYIYNTQATAVIVKEGLELKKPLQPTLLFVKDPYLSFSSLLNKYQFDTKRKQGIEQPAYIHPDAMIGHGTYVGAFSYLGSGVQVEDGVQIYPNCYVGEQVNIGANTILYSGVKIYPDAKIGKNCILHAGAVIGSDGFGNAPSHDGSYRKIPQIGSVILEDEVEIGANATIDRATIGITLIKKGVKIDNLVQIAHNVEIGTHTVIAALSGIAGSTKIGSYCMMGGQVGIGGHLIIGDKTMIAGQAGVTKSYQKGHITLMGMPALERKIYLKSYALFKQLHDLFRKKKD